MTSADVSKWRQNCGNIIDKIKYFVKPKAIDLNIYFERTIAEVSSCEGWSIYLDIWYVS